jgi:hypothetical protein
VKDSDKQNGSYTTAAILGRKERQDALRAHRGTVNVVLRESEEGEAQLKLVEKELIP